MIGTPVLSKPQSLNNAKAVWHRLVRQREKIDDCISEAERMRSTCLKKGKIILNIECLHLAGTCTYKLLKWAIGHYQKEKWCEGVQASSGYNLHL